MSVRYYRFEDVDLMAASLLKGEAIAFPTDTVFGLACVYDCEEAIEKVKAMKHRDRSKALPMMCSDISMVENVAYLNEDARKLMEAFFPGPLTIVFDKREEIPGYVTNGYDTIAIRIPDVDEILKLIEKVGKPLLVTSANLSGEPSIQSYEEVLKKLGDHLDGIVLKDAASKTASTIVDVRDGLTILREGALTEEMLKQAIKGVSYE